jgi:undecaprenyl diphosphate synthase
MIYWLYEYLLKRQITELPGHVCFMISGQDLADAPENPALITAWCKEISEFVLKHNRGSMDLPFISALRFQTTCSDSFQR